MATNNLNSPQVNPHNAPNSQQNQDGPRIVQRDLRILYWNLRSYERRQPELQTIIKDIDILICAETRLRPKDTRSCSFPGFHTIRQDREYGGGGGTPSGN